MGACRRNTAGRTAGTGWDILLIDDTAQFDNDKRVSIDKCDGTTIITIRCVETAIDVLRTIAVEVIYNFTITQKREDAEKFRSHVSERYPKIRLMDMWTPSSRGEGEKTSHVLPLFMREGFDCDVRQRMSRNEVNADGARLPGPPVDSEGAEKTKSRLTISDEHAA